MVDVVFVLMLFFMASAGMQITELELNLNLPGSKQQGGPQTEEIQLTPMEVDIDAAGMVSVNGMPKGYAQDKDLGELLEFLKLVIVESGNKDPVIIRPHRDTKHERIMDVLSVAGKAGVKNLTFQ